jgi:hypothetical protein
MNPWIIMVIIQDGKPKSLKAFETIERRFEKFKTALIDILIWNYELGYCKSVELLMLEYTKVLSCLEAQTVRSNI